MKQAISFSVPLVIGLTCAFFFRYEALLISSYSFILLFALMFISFLGVMDKSLLNQKWDWKGLGQGLFIGQIFVPVLLWIPIYFLIKDPLLQAGLIWASMCPGALVVPLYVSLFQGDKKFSFQLMFLSTLIFPFTAPVILKVLIPHNSDASILPLFRDIFILTISPPFLAFTIWRLAPNVHKKMTDTLQRISWINMVLIGVLSFIFLGAALTKADVAAIDKIDIFSLLVLALLQDFGIYAFLSYLKRWTSDEKKWRATCINSSLKNVALAGGILLIYWPKATLSIAIMFIAHTGMFFFLAMKAHDSKLKRGPLKPENI